MPKYDVFKDKKIRLVQPIPVCIVWPHFFCELSSLNKFFYEIFKHFFKGPVLKFWWFALELKIFSNPKTFMRPFKMMLADQATSPFVLNAAFLYYLAVTDGKSHKDAVQVVKDRCMPIIIESYKVWPFIILLNFYVIPLHSRVLFSNAAAILWTTYLTYLISKTDEKK